MELGHLLTCSDLTYPEVSSKVCHDSFCQLGNSISLPWVLLSTIIKIAELPSRHLAKSHNNNNGQPRLTPCGRLLEYCVDSRHLAAHRATTSSLRATFKFWLFLAPPPPPSYIISNCCKLYVKNMSVKE